jgi:hypothetical protein
MASVVKNISEELKAIYKEYWATKTKFGEQIMYAIDRFGVYSDQVEAIKLKEERAIEAIYDKIEKQIKKEASTGSKKKSKGKSHKKKGKSGKRKNKKSKNRKRR